MLLSKLTTRFHRIETAANRSSAIPRCWCSTLFNSKTPRKLVSIFKPSVEMKHFWQFLIVVISWKYVRRRPIHFVTAPRVRAFHSNAIFAVLHWSFVFKHWTILCCCLILVTISVRRKSKDRSFWWRSLHEVNTSRRGVLDNDYGTQTTCAHVSRWMVPLLANAYPGLYWRYSHMRTRVNMG